MVQDPVASELDRFASYGVSVDIFANIGQYLSLYIILSGIKLFLVLASRLMRTIKLSILDLFGLLNKIMGIGVFYSLTESIHLDLILSIIVYFNEMWRLNI